MAFSDGVVLFFPQPAWRLEVFHFCHCFLGVLFAHFLLLLLFCPSISMVFALVLSPVSVSISESGFSSVFGGVGNINCSAGEGGRFFLWQILTSLIPPAAVVGR